MVMNNKFDESLPMYDFLKRVTEMGGETYGLTEELLQEKFGLHIMKKNSTPEGIRTKLTYFLIGKWSQEVYVDKNMGSGNPNFNELKKEIEKSKGDFNKLNGKTFKEWNRLITSLDTLNSKSGHYNKNFDQDLATIHLAVRNLIKMRSVFSKAYSSNNFVLQQYYNVLVMAIFDFTLNVFCTYVEVMPGNAPGSFVYTVTINNRSGKVSLRNNDSFTALDQFNKSCQDGTFMKASNTLLNKDSRAMYQESLAAFMGGAVGVIGVVSVVLAIVAAILLTIRYFVQYFYFKRQAIADELNTAASILDDKASTVSMNNEEVSKKEHDVADKYRKWANKIRVEDHAAEGLATKTVSKRDEDYTKEFNKNLSVNSSMKDNTEQDNIENSITSDML